jgi:hypothetical protein
MSQANENNESISEIVRHKLIALISLNQVEPREWKQRFGKVGRVRNVAIKGEVLMVYKSPAPLGQEFLAEVQQIDPSLGSIEGVGPWSLNPPVSGQKRLVFCKDGSHSLNEALKNDCKISLPVPAAYPPFAVQDVELAMDLEASPGCLENLNRPEIQQRLHQARSKMGPLLARYLVAKTAPLPENRRVDLLFPLLKARDGEVAMRHELLHWIVGALPYDESSRDMRSRLAAIMFDILQEPTSTAAPLQRNLAESYLYATIFHHHGEPSYLTPRHVFGESKEHPKSMAAVLNLHPFQNEFRGFIKNWLEKN